MQRHSRLENSVLSVVCFDNGYLEKTMDDSPASFIRVLSVDGPAFALGAAFSFNIADVPGLQVGEEKFSVVMRFRFPAITGETGVVKLIALPNGSRGDGHGHWCKTSPRGELIPPAEGTWQPGDVLLRFSAPRLYSEGIAALTAAQGQLENVSDSGYTEYGIYRLESP